MHLGDFCYRSRPKVLLPCYFPHLRWHCFNFLPIPQLSALEKNLMVGKQDQENCSDWRGAHMYDFRQKADMAKSLDILGRLWLPHAWHLGFRIRTSERDSNGNCSYLVRPGPGDFDVVSAACDYKASVVCKTGLDYHAVAGGWGEWDKEWSGCSATCGGGTRIKRRWEQERRRGGKFKFSSSFSFVRRRCNNPEPRNDGANCRGNAIKTEDCNTQECSEQLLVTLQTFLRH